jgi:cysteine-rich repeat protein
MLAASDALAHAHHAHMREASDGSCTPSVSGDGCSADCSIEVGWHCTDPERYYQLYLPVCSASECSPICGDGRRLGSEECDDGNVGSMDGCSLSCFVECGFDCSGVSPTTGVSVCAPSCGDGVWSYYLEGCDDGNTMNGDGCSSTCTVEDGWVTTGSFCGPSGSHAVCGDGRVVGGEACDGEEWCSALCKILCGWTCSSANPTTCNPVCGDGMRKGGEKCDDFNIVDGDGCSASCSIEAGYSCSGAAFGFYCGGDGDTCENCGSGTRPFASSKQCDDANTVNGDGCSSSCRIECGYKCTGGSSEHADSCTAKACGDQRLGGTEQCDDGNGVDGDGCSSSCSIESGFTCLHYDVSTHGCGTKADVCSEVCGDGRVVGSERGRAGFCDDGDSVSSDGCSATCTVECGFACTGGSPAAPDTCISTCGDGKLAVDEECEDGNLVDGDGCTATCFREANWGKPVCTLVVTIHTYMHREMHMYMLTRIHRYVHYTYTHMYMHTYTHIQIQ